MLNGRFLLHIYSIDYCEHSQNHSASAFADFGWAGLVGRAGCQWAKPRVVNGAKPL